MEAWRRGPYIGRARRRAAEPVVWQQLLTPYTWAEKFESFERINSIRETNGNFDSCNSCKRLVSSRLHELHESKFPFVSRIEFIRSKLSNFSAHVYGVTVGQCGKRSANSLKYLPRRRPPIMSTTRAGTRRQTYKSQTQSGLKDEVGPVDSVAHKSPVSGAKCRQDDRKTGKRRHGKHIHMSLVVVIWVKYPEMSYVHMERPACVVKQCNRIPKENNSISR